MDRHRQGKAGQREQVAELKARMDEAESRVENIEKYLQSSGMASVLDNYDFLISLARDMNARLMENDNLVRQMSAYHQVRERAVREHLGPKWDEFAKAVELQMAEIVKRETEAHTPKPAPEQAPAPTTATPTDIEKARQERLAKLKEEEGGSGEP
jgi:hypothetical protein